MCRLRRPPKFSSPLHRRPTALLATPCALYSTAPTPCPGTSTTRTPALPPSYFSPSIPRTAKNSLPSWTTPAASFSSSPRAHGQSSSSEAPKAPESPESNPQSDHKQVDERTIALGRTIRVLHERMPTLLQSPLPTEILSPSISLHLFPTTHPHLPAVRGRVAYIAALWSAPVAWGRLPGGHTTLEVVSERMLEPEKLRILWRAGEQDGGEWEFSGIFEFEFDEKGRVKRHVIENSEGDERKVTGVVSVAEWLLRKARGVQDPEPGVAFCRLGDERRKRVVREEKREWR